MGRIVDLFSKYPFGQAALKQLAPVPENFRLFKAEWLGERPEEFRVMEVRGAEFRAAKSGPNKGKLTVIIPGTVRTVYVTKDEIRACAAPPTTKTGVKSAEHPKIEDTPDCAAPVVDRSVTQAVDSAEVAMVVLEACARGIAAGSDTTIADMVRPGTIVWTDPLTKEEKYAPPGSRMYSTALMYADYVIDKHGQRQPFAGGAT